MNELEVRRFLGALRRAVRQVRLYPDGHPLTDEAITAAETAADRIIGADGEAALSIMDDAFYLNRSLLPHSSLEYNGLLREMQQRGIESITLLSVVSRQDLTDLAAFIAGTTGDLPADESTLPMPFQAVDNILLPIAREKLAMNSAGRRFTGNVPLIMQAAESARKQLRSLTHPQRHVGGGFRMANGW